MGFTQAQPRPFYTFLLKVASRCNLDCDYCYIYHRTDQSWRSRPRFMSDEVTEATAERIAEHVRAHQLREVQVVFHGGEPMLAGPTRLRHILTLLRDTIPCRVCFGAQTNATLLSEALLELFSEFDLKLGVSLDGGRRANDSHRLYADGSSSHERVLSGLKLMRSKPRWARLWAGFLVVIDLEHDPLEVYRDLCRLAPPSIDFVLPDCHHEAPPPRPAYDARRDAYGRWLSTIFEAWYSEQSPVDIRYFDEIMALMLGAPSELETIGATSVDLIVVEADGQIEAVDTLKAVGREATTLGLDVLRNGFDDALRHPAVYARMSGFEALCSSCRSCPELRNCGGGYIPHRYSAEAGFLNPSVYCEDLRWLFGTIRRHIRADLKRAWPARTR